MDDLSARLTNCFSAVFPELTAQEIPGATMESTGKWDSIATITLLSLIEEEFGSSLGPDELDQLTSYESILNFLQKKKEGVA